MAQDNKFNLLRDIAAPIIIALAFCMMARYTFNEKPDLNGDNCYYYTVASSLATGHGYSDLAGLGNPPTSTFPPGYPLLMTPLRMITDSIVAQKCMNELFVLLSLLLIYFLLLRLKLPASVSFAASFVGAFLPQVYHFSTMMMSESAFLLTAVIVMYCIVRMSEDEETWKSELKHSWLYLMILALALNYHVRTQGLALLAAVSFGLLIRRRWAALGTTIAGFVICYLPWTLRNKILGLSSSRYIDMVMVANPWRPEEGAITIPEFISRFFDTAKMLVFQAIPSTIIPFANVNPDEPVYTTGIFVLGAIMLILIVLGSWQMGKLRWTMLGYIAATIGIISVFSTPSGSRYITSILPLLAVAEFIGAWWLLSLALNRLIKNKTAAQAIPAFGLLLFAFTAKPMFTFEHELSTQRFPLPYTQFFQIGKELSKKTPKNAVICSRKNELMHLYSNRPGCGYLFTTDAEALVRSLIRNKVDYVVVDALGYSSTPRYLIPAVQKYSQYFPILIEYEDTHTYLLQFLRDKAERELGTD